MGWGEIRLFVCILDALNLSFFFIHFVCSETREGGEKTANTSRYLVQNNGIIQHLRMYRVMTVLNDKTTDHF
jgi:hypothetical protein